MTYDFNIQKFKRLRALQRKIAKQKLYTNDKTPEGSLRDFAKRSPEFLPTEIIKKKF